MALDYIVEKDEQLRDMTLADSLEYLKARKLLPPEFLGESKSTERNVAVLRMRARSADDTGVDETIPHELDEERYEMWARKLNLTKGEED